MTLSPNHPAGAHRAGPPSRSSVAPLPTRPVPRRAVGTVAGCVATLTAALLPTGCGRGSNAAAPKIPPPAKVASPVKEADLAVITLTPEAERRLLIPQGLAKVVRKAVPATTAFPGEVVVPPGRSAFLTAPFTGVIEPAGEPPVAGSRVTRGGGAMYRLTPLPSPERMLISPAERTALRLTAVTIEQTRAGLELRVAELRAKLAADMADAEGNLARAKVRLDAAEIARRRAEQLVRDMAAGTRALDEAVAAVDTAKAELAAAQARRDVLADTKFDAPSIPATSGTTEPAGDAPAVVLLEPPLTGIVRDVRVAPGQKVTAGQVLSEVIDPAELWLRVAVPVAELAGLTPGASAVVLDVSARPRPTGAVLEPVAAPPTADPLRETADLYFRLPESEGPRRPGERIWIGLPRRGADASASTVPWAAVLFDAWGGAWVYETVGPQKYARRRVSPVRVHEGIAVLSDADLREGTSVVTTGAAELLGVEFGAGK